MEKEKIIIRAQTELRLHAEVLWFHGEKEGDSGTGEALRKHYHEIHDIVKDLDKLRWQVHVSG